MTIVIPYGPSSLPGLSTGVSHPGFMQAVSVARLPTDPLFYSTVTLINIIVGSRYRLSTNDGTELTKGTAASTTVELTSIPAYANPQLLRLDVRYSSDTTKYIPMITYTYQDREGAGFYISQVVDAVA